MTSVYLLLGGKGGVGVTTLAVNLAVVHARQGAATLLIEADDHGVGDSAAHLGTPQVRALHACHTDLPHATSEVLRGYLRVAERGIGALTLGAAADTPPSPVEAILEALWPRLTAAYPVIVIDAGVDVAAAVQRWRKRATHWACVVAPDGSALTAAQRTIRRLQAAFIAPPHRCLIGNRFTPAGPWTCELAAARLDHPIAWTLPEETSVATAVLEGRPLLAAPSQSGWAQALRGLAEQWAHVPALPTTPDRSATTATVTVDPAALLTQVRTELEASHPDLAAGDRGARRAVVEPICLRVLDAVAAQLPPTCDRSALLQSLLDEILGYGPLEPLLADPEITEIMINGGRELFIERQGRLERRATTLRDRAQVQQLIERLLAPSGRRVDERTPVVDARLPDGARLHVVLPPVAVDGPAVTIRRFSPDPWTLERLVAAGSLSAALAAELAALTAARRNMVVSGGTGSGKTTLLNALSAAVPAHERIITIEDAAELRLQQPHCVRLESRPANLEGEGAITIRDLVRAALRMRPDRIIVGECRGGEALDMLQAMNTGHDGSLTTVHANSPAEAVQRLTTLVAFAGVDLPLRVIHEQIAAAIDVVVHVARRPDGRRVVEHVVSLHGYRDGVWDWRPMYSAAEAAC